MVQDMKRNILYIAVILLAVVSVTWAVASSTNDVEVKSALAGTVVADRLVTNGQIVKEGDVLVCVQTITGTAVAARATADGTVSEVLVTPGVKVKSGDVVVKLHAAQ